MVHQSEKKKVLHRRAAMSSMMVASLFVLFLLALRVYADDSYNRGFNPFQSSCDGGDWSACERAVEYDQQTADRSIQSIGSRANGTSLSTQDVEMSTAERYSEANSRSSSQAAQVQQTIADASSARNMYEAAEGHQRAMIATSGAMRAATIALGTTCGLGVTKVVLGATQIATPFTAILGKINIITGKKMLIACPLAVLTASAGKRVVEASQTSRSIAALTRCRTEGGEETAECQLADAPLYTRNPDFPDLADDLGNAAARTPNPAFPQIDLDRDGDIDANDQRALIRGEQAALSEAYSDPRLPQELRQIPQDFDWTVGELKKRGYAFDTQSGVLKTPFGKTHVKDMLTPQGMRSMGLAPGLASELAALQGELQKVLEKQKQRYETQLSSSNSSRLLADGADEHSESQSDVRRPRSGLGNSRGPASAADSREGVGGLSVDHSGDRIGVAGDNVFQMMSRRYRRLSGMGYFWLDSQNNPAPVGLANGDAGGAQ